MEYQEILIIYIPIKDLEKNKEIIVILENQIIQAIQISKENWNNLESIIEFYNQMKLIVSLILMDIVNTNVVAVPVLLHKFVNRVQILTEILVLPVHVLMDLLIQILNQYVKNKINLLMITFWKEENLKTLELLMAKVYFQGQIQLWCLMVLEIIEILELLISEDR